MIPTVLKRCEARPPAPESDISNVERILGSSLPSDYRALIRESNGMEGFVAPEAYLLLWSISELPSLNEAYAVGEFLPGVILIGTDGGDTGYGFRFNKGRIEYLSTQLVGMNPAALTVMGPTLEGLAERIRDDR